MELRQLDYFVAVAEELHFGRAAERLHIVQPAVSQQLRRLEAELGTKLVDRSTRRVALTPAGERFLPEARAVLAAAKQAREAMADFVAERSATLRIGTSSGLGDRLSRLLGALAQSAPGTAVELVRLPVAGRLAQVAGGDLDAAFVRGAAAHPGLRLEPVWDDALLAALPAAHPLARADAIALGDLAPLPLRLPAREANPALVDLVVGACRNAGFAPLPAPAMNDQDMLAAIGAGPPTWSVYYAPQTELLAAAPTAVAFRPLAPPLRMPTLLALPAASDEHHAVLLAACRAISA
jgi:DNA-binding transcriptional LysR family regulator